MYSVACWLLKIRFYMPCASATCSLHAISNPSILGREDSPLGRPTPIYRTLLLMKDDLEALDYTDQCIPSLGLSLCQKNAHSMLHV